MRSHLKHMLLLAAVYAWAYAYNVLAAVSQLGNALLAGNRDMSISGRTGHAYEARKPWARVARPLIDFFFGRGHCRKSVEWEEGGESFQSIVRQLKRRWVPEETASSPAPEPWRLQ